MAFKFFTIPVRDPSAQEAEVNAFLASHRILVADRRFVDAGENSFWSICVDFLSSAAGPPGQPGGRKGRVDYRELLTPADFAVFVKLRDLRKELAQREAVPVYTIFTNEQLAEMARRRMTTPAELETIVGVGDARVAKYGAQFLAASAPARAGHEAGREPDGGDRSVGKPPGRSGPGTPR